MLLVKTESLQREGYVHQISARAVHKWTSLSISKTIWARFQARCKRRLLTLNFFLLATCWSHQILPWRTRVNCRITVVNPNLRGDLDLRIGVRRTRWKSLTLIWDCSGNLRRCMRVSLSNLFATLSICSVSSSLYYVKYHYAKDILRWRIVGTCWIRFTLLCHSTLFKGRIKQCTLIIAWVTNVWMFLYI